MPWALTASFCAASPCLGRMRDIAQLRMMSAFDPKRTLSGVLCCSAKRVSALSKHLLEPVRCSLLGSWRVGDSTVVRLSAPGAVRHDVAHQVAHVVLQISDDVLDDVSDRDHAHDLARIQHW